MYRYVRHFFNGKYNIFTGKYNIFTGKYNIFTGNDGVDVYSGSVEDLKSQKNQIFYFIKQRC